MTKKIKFSFITIILSICLLFAGPLFNLFSMTVAFADSNMVSTLHEETKIYRANENTFDGAARETQYANQTAKSVGLIKDSYGDAAPKLSFGNGDTTGNKNERLLYLFNLNGLTAYKVADLLDYKDSSRVYKWLYNKAEPNASTMLKLSEILNCSAEDRFVVCSPSMNM